MQQRDISLELKDSLCPLELRLCHKNVTGGHGKDIENIVKREVEVMNKVHAEGRGMKMGYRVGFIHGPKVTMMSSSFIHLVRTILKDWLNCFQSLN